MPRREHMTNRKCRSDGVGSIQTWGDANTKVSDKLKGIVDQFKV